jgi:hypothetical protein
VSTPPDDNAYLYLKHWQQRRQRRDARMAAVTAGLDSAIAAVLDTSSYQEELDGQDARDPDGRADWLSARDLTAFRQQIHTAEHALRTAAAIHRPHPGTPLWPQISPWSTGHLQYAVRCETVELDQPVYVGGFDDLTDAERKAEQLRQGAHVLKAEVKVRTFSATTWSDPRGGDRDG